jgi:hypothetical protein
MIGQIVGFEESRRIMRVYDTQGKVVELKPEANSETLCLRLRLNLPSGRSVEFSVVAPPEVVPYWEEARVPRSIEELALQLKNDLSGVEDGHDRAVKQAQGDMTHEQLKAVILGLSKDPVPPKESP